jgi:group I intron endonuclease
MYIMKTYIYTLKHPETFEVRYVGKTNNIKRRFAQHKSKKCLEKTGSKKLAAWIMKLLSINLTPIMEIIEECEENWVEREKCWISYYSDNNLCNLSEGGEGVGHNESTKQKIKNSLKGRVRTQEERDAISKGMKGKKRPNSGKAISEANKKRCESLEERMKHGVKLRKKVGQYDLNNNFITDFVSAREASRQLNIDCGYISKSCRLNVPHKGFYYKYL